MTLKELQEKLQGVEIKEITYQQLFQVRTKKGVMVSLTFKNNEFNKLIVEGKEPQATEVRKLLGLI